MLLGVDVSKWQGEIAWSKCRNAGAKFAFIRAGSISSVGGECYTDYQFERNAKIAPDYLPIGFYWYFRPQHDPIAQANYFCSLIRDKRYVLPPVLDLEETGDLAPAPLTYAAEDFIRQVYQRLNVWCLLYSRAVWLNDYTIFIPLWLQLDLWLARYKAGLTSPWSDGKCVPRDFQNWKFWQCSADGNGRGAEFGAGSHSIPVDLFNGDEKELDLYCGATVAPHLIKVKRTIAVSLRSGPGGPAIGATWRGMVWPILGRSAEGDYYRVEAWIKANDVKEI
jgi:lysozyme